VITREDLAVSPLFQKILCAIIPSVIRTFIPLDIKSGAKMENSHDGESLKSLKAGTGSPDQRSGA